MALFNTLFSWNFREHPRCACPNCGWQTFWQLADGRVRCERCSSIVTSFVMPARCPLHGEELIETHPADAENGPSPSDVLNELVCPVCVNEDANNIDSILSEEGA